jgi:CheY-like chemotaxis protein
MADILVIDDHQQIRRLARTVLEAEGHLVREATSGAEGIEAFRERPADLVLCDLLMPEMDGLQVLEQLRTESADVKVIVMTALTDIVPQSAPRDAVRMLLKPFRPQVLLATVGAMLERVASAAD